MAPPPRQAVALRGRGGDQVRVGLPQGGHAAVESTAGLPLPGSCQSRAWAKRVGQQALAPARAGPDQISVNNPPRRQGALRKRPVQADCPIRSPNFMPGRPSDRGDPLRPRVTSSGTSPLSTNTPAHHDLDGVGHVDARGPATGRARWRSACGTCRSSPQPPAPDRACRRPHRSSGWVLPARRNPPVVASLVTPNPAFIRLDTKRPASSSCTMAMISFIQAPPYVKARLLCLTLIIPESPDWMQTFCACGRPIRVPEARRAAIHRRAGSADRGGQRLRQARTRAGRGGQPIHPAGPGNADRAGNPRRGLIRMPGAAGSRSTPPGRATPTARGNACGGAYTHAGRGGRPIHPAGPGHRQARPAPRSSHALSHSSPAAPAPLSCAPQPVHAHRPKVASPARAPSAAAHVGGVVVKISDLVGRAAQRRFTRGTRPDRAWYA